MKQRTKLLLAIALLALPVMAQEPFQPCDRGELWQVIGVYPRDARDCEPLVVDEPEPVDLPYCYVAMQSPGFDPCRGEAHVVWLVAEPDWSDITIRTRILDNIAFGNYRYLWPAPPDYTGTPCSSHKKCHTSIGEECEKHGSSGKRFVVGKKYVTERADGCRECSDDCENGATIYIVCCPTESYVPWGHVPGADPDAERVDVPIPVGAR